jgi:hypothetical protein
MDEDFTDYVQKEQEEPLLDSLETSDADTESSDADSESSGERRYLGAGLLFGVAAAGIRSMISVLGGSARKDSDDRVRSLRLPQALPRRLHLAGSLQRKFFQVIFK